jgi:hypothetical protein
MVPMLKSPFGTNTQGQMWKDLPVFLATFVALITFATLYVFLYVLVSVND